MSTQPYAFSNDEAVEQAMKALKNAGARYIEKKTSFQIKIGHFNYYPAKGTIYHDGEQKARSERGVQSLIGLLRKSGMIVAERAPAGKPATKLVVPD